MDLRRLAPLALLVPAVAAGATLSPHWPKAQSIRCNLGDVAPRVAELRVRAVEQGAGDDWLREATFRYPAGQAPRVVSYEPRIPDGDYTVEVDVQVEGRLVSTRRRVKLEGGVTTLDLAGLAR